MLELKIREEETRKPALNPAAARSAPVFPQASRCGASGRSQGMLYPLEVSAVRRSYALKRLSREGDRHVCVESRINGLWRK